MLIDLDVNKKFYFDFKAHYSERSKLFKPICAFLFFKNYKMFWFYFSTGRKGGTLKHLDMEGRGKHQRIFYSTFCIVFLHCLKKIDRLALLTTDPPLTSSPTLSHIQYLYFFMFFSVLYIYLSVFSFILCSKTTSGLSQK